jgi:GTP-binding protein HflX
MEEGVRSNLEVESERAVLVKVLLTRSEQSDEDPLGELRALVHSAGGQVVGELLQKRDRPKGSSYLGKGKLEELVHLVEMVDAKVVVFDNELAPMQIRTIEEAISCKVLDRSELILDIFATRAQTREARLQVEIAQLQYTAPRLRAMWSHLGQVTGGAPIGVGTRGPGEQQLEIDRRLVQKRLSQLRERLVDVQKRKVREVGSRTLEHFTVGLVGYTNAGKSTLFNVLTDGGAWVADQLFATLGTRVEAWPLGGGAKALLSDTVGFISNLPHHLVASFRSTLEETVQAHVLVIVLDVSDRSAVMQYETVLEVLDGIGAGDQPRILVLNKVDLVRERVNRGLGGTDPVEAWMERDPDALVVSARTGEGLETLSARVKELMKGPLREVSLEAPMSDGRLMDFLEKRTEVLERSWTETTSVYRVRIGRRQVEQLLARGSSFTLDGAPGQEGLDVLWPPPPRTAPPPIPPHAREWPEEHLG